MPNFEKAKYTGGPWGALFASFWELLAPFLKATVDTLRQGVPVQRFLDVEVGASQSFPMPALQNPLPAGVPIHGVATVAVFDPYAQGRPVGLTGGVTVEWTTSKEGGLVPLTITGLPAGKRVTVRVLVFAE